MIAENSNNIGNIHHNNNSKYDQALIYYEQALEIDQKNLFMLQKYR